MTFSKPGKFPYLYEVLPKEHLLAAFSKESCCSENCLSQLCEIKEERNNLHCSTCLSTHLVCSTSSSTTESRCSHFTSRNSNEYAKVFFDIVDANREPYLLYREKDSDKNEDKTEKKKLFMKDLMMHFKTFGRIVNGTWKWAEAYHVLDECGERKYVCKNAWCGIVGVKLGILHHIQQKIRNHDDIHAINPGPAEKITWQDALRHWNIEPELFQSHAQAFCVLTEVPNTHEGLVCAAFLCDQFNLMGEAQPGVLAIHYDPLTDAELHQMYLDDPFVKSISNNPLAFSSFTKILRTAFPKCNPREYKAVSGKCDICERNRTLSKQCTLRSDRLIIKRYRMLHRNKFMGEKLKYYARQQEAIESNGRVWSFIFDSMSKFKTKLPILSNVTGMSASFENNVMGCIFHNGPHTQLYISGPSVKSGASYMIHCVHAEIKRLIEDEGMTPPDKIYIEIDGASDNTAYAVFGAMEHLVHAGLCSTIEVWRLMVGHTHEDIDGRFGVLSTHIRGATILTPQQFATFAKSAFHGVCGVTYVAAIFDYKAFSDQFIDPFIVVKKQDYTNLGFRFERLSLLLCLKLLIILGIKLYIIC
jgi:hypothetical protein